MGLALGSRWSQHALGKKVLQTPHTHTPNHYTMSANSLNLSAQIDMDLDRNLVRIGKKPPGKLASGTRSPQGSRLGLDGGPRGHSLNLLKKYSQQQALAGLNHPRTLATPALYSAP